MPEVFHEYCENTRAAYSDSEWPTAEQKRRSGLVDIDVFQGEWYHPASGHVYKRGGKKLPKATNPMWFDVSSLPRYHKNKEKEKLQQQKWTI